MLWRCGAGTLSVIRVPFAGYKWWTLVSDARRKTNKRTVLLYGESATTPSITVACPFGWSRTIAVPSASRTGWFRELANNSRRSGSSGDTCVHLKVVWDLTMITAASCAESHWPWRLSSYLSMHVPVVPVSKEDDGQNKMVQTLWSLIGGCGWRNHEEVDEPCFSVWSHVSFMLLSVVVSSTSWTCDFKKKKITV